MRRHNSSIEVTNSAESGGGGAAAAAAASAAPLPTQFVQSMKTLFDILDDRRCGYVKFSDIERGWQDAHCIELLRQVTPASGQLSFERFCAGLKLCLKQQTAEATRPTSAPLCSRAWGASVQLSPAAMARSNSPPPPPAPPKPPRAAATQLGMPAGCAAGPKAPTSTQSKAEIRNALQHWQMNVLLNEMEAQDKPKSSPTTISNQHQFPCRFRGCADGGSSSSATESPNNANTNNVAGHRTLPPSAAKKTGHTKRREARRHTLQNSLDYNVMVRRMKQLEEEQEMLLLALNAVERARDCYLQQIASVQEKMKYLGLTGRVDQSEEAQQEHFNFQRARCLAALAETCYPLHLNLAFPNKNAV